MEEKDFLDILQDFPDRRLLKRGGQRIAFKINHPKYGEIVMKVGEYDSAKTQERIKREVEVLSNTESEYFPRIHELQEYEGNRFSICEQFIEGEPLSACMAKFYDPASAIQLISEMAND